MRFFVSLIFNGLRTISKKDFAYSGGCGMMGLSAKQQQHNDNIMKTTLAKFRYLANRKEIAKLEGMKSIMRIEYLRKAEWWLVLPAVGDSDSVCVLIRRVRLAKCYRKDTISYEERQILSQYADRLA